MHVTFHLHADDVRYSVWLWCVSAAILKCDIKMKSGVNDNSGIHFADQEIIILKYRSDATTSAKMKLLPIFGRHLEFQVKESPVKVGIATVKKLTLKNMGIVFRILSQSGTEREIYLGYCTPQLPRTF